MVPHKKIALIGANGMLASMLRNTAPAAAELHLFDLPGFDITDRDNVAEILTPVQPDIIINCAAFTQVDACESQQETAFQVNAEGPGHLAAVAKRTGSLLLHISTDFVFSGEKTTPYVEADTTAALSVYGQSKLQGEQAILNSGLKDYYLIRTSWLYGPHGHNFVETIARLASEREELGIVADQKGTPTFTADLADVIWTLAGIKGCNQVAAPFGIYHYSNAGICSWYEFACEIIQQLRESGADVKVQQVKPLTSSEYPLPAPRPAYSVLSKQKLIAATGLRIPPWQESLRIYMESRKAA